MNDQKRAMRSAALLPLGALVLVLQACAPDPGDCGGPQPCGAAASAPTDTRATPAGASVEVADALTKVAEAVNRGAARPESPDPAATSQLAAAITKVADAVDQVAKRLPARTDSPAPGRAPVGSAAGNGVASWWWAAAVIGLALLYFVLSRGGDDPWINGAKIVAAWAAALTATAGMVTAGAGAWAAMRKAIRPSQDSLALPIVEFVTVPPQSWVFTPPRDGSAVSHRESKTLLTFAIPYGEASCHADTQHRWPNTYPSADSELFIQRLAAGLANCAGSRGKPALEVRGFASSSEVVDYQECDGAKTSDDANLAIAHRRQAEVADLLRRESRNSIDVLAPRWDGFGQMRDDREYNDRSLDNTYSTERGVLTRRVEIRLLSAGACAIASPAPPPGGGAK